MPIKAEALSVYLGKSNLENLGTETGFVLSPVSEISIHPDWKSNSRNHGADLAAMILSITSQPSLSSQLAFGTRQVLLKTWLDQKASWPVGAAMNLEALLLKSRNGRRWRWSLNEFVYDRVLSSTYWQVLEHSAPKMKLSGVEFVTVTMVRSVFIDPFLCNLMSLFQEEDFTTKKMENGISEASFLQVSLKMETVTWNIIPFILTSHNLVTGWKILLADTAEFDKSNYLCR